MKDKIDERNFKEKVARSIIKRYNVHYISQEELDRQRVQEEREKAQEIVKKLQAEKAAKESEKLREIERMRLEVERRQREEEALLGREEDFVAGVTKGQVEQLLSDKE